jgi:hypothetical protein
MNTKDVILFGAGFLLGYIVFNNRKNTNVLVSQPSSGSQVKTESNSAINSGSTQIKEPEVTQVTEDDPKITKCKEKWVKFAETRKFGSAEQEQATYDNFMASCVVQSS